MEIPEAPADLDIDIDLSNPTEKRLLVPSNPKKMARLPAQII